MSSKVGIFGILLSAILVLASCGSSSDGVPASAPSAKLDGTVTDAVITNGSLRVYEFDNGQQGALIAETVTDGQGDFVFDNFTSPDRPIVIEIRDGRYTEEASGVSVELLPGQVLRAYMFYEQGNAITVQITPLTHLASCLADYKIGTGINVNNAITEATSVFSGLAGIDILGTKPLDITDPNNANFEVTDSLRYGTLLAAISSFTAEVSETNGVTPHRFNQNSSIYATQVLCQDIAADGIFNGLGFINNGNSVGQLSLGSVALTADTFRSDIAQNILSIMSSDRNNTGLGVDDFVLYANEIASSTDVVYGGMPATAVDQEGPISTAVLSPDSFIKGLVDLSFNVTDPIGLKTVQFEVNGLLNSSAQVDNPVLSLNTTNYTDGIITITVVAKDVLNNESRTDFQYVVDNSSPTIALTSPTLVNNKSYTATGTYEIAGAPIAAITVNGVNASIDAVTGTWSAGIDLLSGDNIVTVQITDTVGNTNSLDISVGVDLINPTISVNPTLTTFTTYQGQLNLCTSGQITTTSASGNPICLSTDNVSLNGATLDGNLQNQGFALLGFSPTDPQGAGVFTSQENLIVEYKYELNDTEIMPWTTAPKAAGSDLYYYFPMVTEYLGINFFQTATTDIHKVTFRATDMAGNFKELVFVVQFDVLIPEIAINATIDDSVFTTTTFNNRTAIDGNAVTVSYEFNNPSSSAYLISLVDDENHAVTHTFETGIRENMARLVTTNQWQFQFAKQSNTGGITMDWTGWMQPATVYDGTGSPISTTRITNGAYTSFNVDTPVPPNDTSWTFVPTETIYNYTPRKVTFYTAFTFSACLSMYESTDLSNTRGYGAYTLLANVGDSCAPVGSDWSQQHWQERNSYNYELQAGYPRNTVTPATLSYNIGTELITVTNSTLGQVILPINGWYKVPASTSIAIAKKIRLPVIDHYQDSELGNIATFASYAQKKYDKQTTWSLDTDLTISRVIDPGDMNDVYNVTPSISVAGLGNYQATIGR